MFNHKKYNKKYYQKHKKELQDYGKKYMKEHYQEHKKYHKNYRKEHQEKIKKQEKEYKKNKLNKDINFKLSHYLRVRLNHAIKNNSKFISVIKLLGCSIEQLKKHLKKKFKKSMSWKNYGLWHIDHIRPCCSFDLRKKKEQRKCFHYTNLQPLWAEQNFAKRKFDNLIRKRGYNG